MPWGGPLARRRVPGGDALEPLTPPTIGGFSALIVPLYLAEDPKAAGWRFRLVLEAW